MTTKKKAVTPLTRQRPHAAKHSAKPDNWDDNAHYEVKLARPIMHGHTMLNTGGRVVLKGWLARQYAADIIDAKPLDQV